MSLDSLPLRAVTFMLGVECTHFMSIHHTWKCICEHHKQNHLNFSIRWYFHEQKPGVLKYLLLWNPFLNAENNLFLSCASPVEVKSTGLLITLFKFTYLNISTAAGLLFLSTLDSNNKMLFLFERNCLCNKPFLETTVLLSTRQLESHEEFTTQFLTLYHLHVL